MNLIKPEISFFNDKVEDDYIRKIEHCARVCYKSENKIDLEYNVDQSKQMDDDDIKKANEMKEEMLSLNKSMHFLGSLIARGHTSVLEHYRPIYKINKSFGEGLLRAKQIYNLKYIEITPSTASEMNRYENPFDESITDNDIYYISGNLRSFYDIKDIAKKDKYLKELYLRLSDDFELLFQDKYLYKTNAQKSKIAKFFDFLSNLINKEEFFITNINGRSINDPLIRSIHQGITVKIISNRSFSHEVVRHRVGSYSQESSRYCDYTKDKFKKELTFIDPNTTINRILDGDKNYPTKKLMRMNKNEIIKEIENLYSYVDGVYKRLRGYGCATDLARNVLPIGIKTEVVMSMTAKEWRDSFFSLRLTDNVHPDMLNISRPLLKEFKNKYESLFEDINY